MKQKYDVFIGYRRSTGAKYAVAIKEELTKQGCNVFLDYSDIQNGDFNYWKHSILTDIPVFILILSKNALDNCINRNDWLRMEIQQAISENKRFVIAVPNNEFSGSLDQLPTDISELLRIHQKFDVDFEHHLKESVQMILKNVINPTLKETKITLMSRILGWLRRQDKYNSVLNSYIPKQVDFDIFVSYRREDGREYARNIELALKAQGYKNVFFDYNSIQSGEFTKRIIDAIYSCNDFILVLSPKSMKRCVKNGDPVANEIRTALKYKKNIIPVTIDGKSANWPRKFPKDLEPIKGIQFHDLKTDSYFDDSIEALCSKLTTKKEK